MFIKLACIYWLRHNIRLNRSNTCLNLFCYRMEMLGHKVFPRLQWRTHFQRDHHERDQERIHTLCWFGCQNHQVGRSLLPLGTSWQSGWITSMKTQMLTLDVQQHNTYVPLIYSYSVIAMEFGILSWKWIEYVIDNEFNTAFQKYLKIGENSPFVDQ